MSFRVIEVSIEEPFLKTRFDSSLIPLMLNKKCCKSQEEYSFMAYLSGIRESIISAKKYFSRKCFRETLLFRESILFMEVTQNWNSVFWELITKLLFELCPCLSGIRESVVRAKNTFRESAFQETLLFRESTLFRRSHPKLKLCILGTHRQTLVRTLSLLGGNQESIVMSKNTCCETLLFRESTFFRRSHPKLKL